MKIFISWSGKLSKEVGIILKQHLPAILNVEVFMSAHDIESGSRWSEKLSFELEKSNYGIVCFSPENLEAPWLLYEAGAISKLGGAAVCGLLLSHLKQTDISGPLSQFQNRRFIEGDISQLLLDINKKQKNPKDESQIQLLFEAIWPKIDEQYETLLKRNESGSKPYKERPERELLEELLFRVRSLESKSYNKIKIADLNLEGVLELPINSGSISAYSKLKFPDLSISNSWQEQLITDLEFSKYQYIRDIDAVLKIAANAIEKYKEKNPHLFHYSTDYLTKSLGFVDQEFREVHPWGVSTLQAFEKFEYLLKGA